MNASADRGRIIDCLPPHQPHGKDPFGAAPSGRWSAIVGVIVVLGYVLWLVLEH